ncbi:MAG TPA: site-specific integrase [Nitrospiraceae bacterium]|nr:site-specific integrase [Nitrospiraceae bacterium]
MLSAINTVARTVDRRPAEILVDVRLLNARLRQVAPVALGIAPARWRNVLSLFRSSLALMGPVMKGRNEFPMSEAWARLHSKIPVRGDRIKLSRLLRWLSERAIAPEAVTAEELERFRLSLCQEALLKNAEATWANVTLAWNRAVERVPGWPQILVIREIRRKTYTRPWSAFPSSLKEDVDNWLARCSGTDLAEDGPPKPLSDGTVEARDYHLRAFASALVHKGCDPQSLTSLAACLTPDRYVLGLLYFRERFGGKSSATAGNMATMLKGVARHWLKADEATLVKMRKIGKKVSIAYHGLTPKNRERLRPFNDLTNCKKLLSLPFELRKEIERGKLPAHRRKTLGQVAVAIELLLMAPIRSKNLVSLDLERHLRLAGRKLMLTIPAQEVKNGVDLDFELPDQSANLIRWYIKSVRETAPGNSALFPSPNGGCKDKDTLAIQVMETVQRYAGFTINLHLFRHIAALIYLRLHPGGYEVVRRVLGHKSMDTTSNFYAGLEATAAARHFDAEILKLRNGSQS